VSRRTLRAALAELERDGWLRVDARQRRQILRARKAAPGSVKKIAVLLPSQDSALLPARALMMDALREKLPAVGYTVEWCVEPACFSPNPARALERLTRAHRAAAWVVVGSKEPMQQWLVRQRVPCLVLGSPPAEMPLPSLDLDYRAVCRHAAGVLWRKGHRHLALVLPRDAFGGDEASEAGMCEAVAALAGARLTVIRHGGRAEQLCASLDAARRPAEPPTGFVVSHASALLTVVTQLLRQGVRIPEEVGVISRDDDPAWSFVQPRIAHYTAGAAPFARRVALAVRQLATGGGVVARAIRLMPRFVPGESV
jgi:DNA-binding LacI/PurR family transcriptional regulator